MSADFWSLTQRTKWQLTRYSLLENRRKLLLLERKMIHNGLIKDHPGVVYDYNMRIYLHNLLIKLGRRLNIRQVALATAEVYLARFLLRVLLKEINVYLLVTACVYVACKIEECPQHIRLITLEARNLWPEYVPQDITKLAEFEFYLVEELDLYLIVHHPYRLLIQLNEYFLGQEQEEAANGSSSISSFSITDEEVQNAWSIINDSYITDVHLLYPPHILAITAIYMTIVFGHGEKEEKRPPLDIQIDDLMALSYTVPVSEASRAARTEKFQHFVANLHVNLDEVAEAISDLFNLYGVWNRYNEGGVKKALQGMLLGR